MTDTLPAAFLRSRSILPLFFLAASLAFFHACTTKMPSLYTVEGRPLTVAEYEKIAVKERDADRFLNAIEAYRMIIVVHGENVAAATWANYEIGFCYFELKEYDEAEIYFRKVINEFQEPAARKLSQDMLTRIVEKKSKKTKKSGKSG